MDTREFQELIALKGRELYRTMPWREETQPYYVWVSEIMLQQTQVDRVIPKFNEFMRRFPNVYSLASASLADVLGLWNGLGYNRRAKYLHDAAKKIVEVHAGTFPDTYDELVSLPGIGPNTAGAIMAYAYNIPIVFVETNIRTVYFHHFFHESDKVHDADVKDTITRTIDQENPREFYWALMDYGTWLKRQGAGRNMLSAHYKKQSSLKGSIREVRGQIIKVLAGADMPEEELRLRVSFDDRYTAALEGVIRDGLVTLTNGVLHLTK